MLYESENLEDSYFEDSRLISENLEGAIERIDIREDCADFTACGLIRFYLENKHRLADENKAEIKECLTGFKYWMDQYDGRSDSMCHWSENHQIMFSATEYLVGCEWPDALFADGKTGEEHVAMAKERINAWMSQRYYSMSTAQEHFAGDYADQHQINIATLGSVLSIYTAQLMRNNTRGQYWVGYGRLPYSVQEKNANISIYTIPENTGMLEPHIVKYTHAYFPVGLFDEVDLSHINEG